MKTKHLTFPVTTLLVLMAVMTLVSWRPYNKHTGPDGRQSRTVQLFNGKDLSNWTFYLKDPSVNPGSVFTIKEGVIHITGNPFGYMRTKEKYSNYRLHVEYRWPVEATNSGVFINAQPPDTIWIKCFECQLAAGNAGDLICMNGTDMNERTDKTRIVVKKLKESSEKPVGEWNTLEAVCTGSSVEVRVNGVLQNKGTGLTVKEGCICLQSEGKDIEFRNVFLTML
jgi:hypothetical protein